MILRLVYSFLFLSIITGTLGGRYGYRAAGLSNANPSHAYSAVTSSHLGPTVIDVVNDNFSRQVPRPVQIIEEEKQVVGKSLCFTPKTVQRLVKAALEYFTKMPSDVNRIIELIDQDIDSIPDVSLEEQPYKLYKPLHTGERTNVILQYEVPGAPEEPQCKEALEKLIEIAYNAYLELMKHPQCKDYLYNYASHQPEDRPTGHTEKAPGLKTLIITLLDLIDKKKPKTVYTTPESDRYGDMQPGEELPIQKVKYPIIDKGFFPTKEYRIPTIEFQSPKEYRNPTIEYIFPKKEYVTPVTEYHIPKKEYIPTKEYHISAPEYHKPKKEYIPVEEYRFPVPEYHYPKNEYIPTDEYRFSAPEFYKPKKEYTPVEEYRFPVTEYHIPKNEYIPTEEYLIPKKKYIPAEEYRFTVPEYHKPKKEYLPVEEYHFPAPEYHIPKKEYIPTEEYLIPKKEYIPTEEYRFPVPEYHKPKKEYIPVEEFHFPAPEYHKPKKGYIPVEEYRFPVTEYHIPKNEYVPTEEYSFPTKEYKVPTTEYIIPVDDYSLPVKEYIPQGQVPVPQDIEILDSEEMPEVIQPVMPAINQPINPEDVTDYIIQTLENDNNAPIMDLIDNVKIITDSPNQTIRPYILRLLKLLTFVPKEQNDIPRFIEILKHLLSSQKNQQWPLSDDVTEQILSYVKPDQSGTIDTRILDIILNLIKMKPHEKHVQHVLHLLQPYKDGYLDQILVDILIRLLNAYQNHLLRPDYIDTLLILLKKSKNGIDEPKAIDVANNLDRWNEMGITPKQLDLIFNNLKPYTAGQTDSKPLDIIHFLLTKSKNLTRPQIDFILTFLNPSKRGIDVKRIDVIHFLLGILHMYPKQVDTLLELLIEDAPGVMNSRFLDILFFLDNEGLLTPDLIDIITNLLQNDVIGQLEENQLKSLLILLKPYKQSNPKMVVDILTLLNQGGLHSKLLDWFKSPQPEITEVPIYQTPEIDLGDLIDKVNDVKHILVKPNASNQNRIPSNPFETPESDVTPIIDWLYKQGLLNQDSAANSEVVNNIVKILQLGDRELGVVELTYMLKHMKPLIYHPVYYVKYRLPIMSFITNLKALLTKNPHLAVDPMKLLQELILISNVTEVSPNLQGYPKDEILKLTFNDGDLVQAKILDEQNLNLNDQITYVHSLNSDITPEDLVELNEVNEAKFYPKVVKFKEAIPEKIVINKVVVPSAHYRQFESGPIITQGPIRTIHNFIQRSNEKPVPPTDTVPSTDTVPATDTKDDNLNLEAKPTTPPK